MDNTIQYVAYCDFRFDFLDGFCKLVVSVFMGCLAGLLYMPAARNARAFWLGTDQSRSYLSIISYGWIKRLLLYVNSLLAIFTALLWVSPFAELLILIVQFYIIRIMVKSVITNCVEKVQGLSLE